MKELCKFNQNVLCFKQFNAVLMNSVNFLPLSLIGVTPE